MVVSRSIHAAANGIISFFRGFPGGSDDKSACSAGDVGLIAGLGRSRGGGHGNPLQHSCLENRRTEEPGGQQSMGSQS